MSFPPRRIVTHQVRSAVGRGSDVGTALHLFLGSILSSRTSLPLFFLLPCHPFFGPRRLHRAAHRATDYSPPIAGECCARNRNGYGQTVRPGAWIENRSPSRTRRRSHEAPRDLGPITTACGLSSRHHPGKVKSTLGSGRRVVRCSSSQASVETGFRWPVSREHFRPDKRRSR